MCAVTRSFNADIYSLCYRILTIKASNENLEYGLSGGARIIAILVVFNSRNGCFLKRMIFTCYSFGRPTW